MRRLVSLASAVAALCAVAVATAPGASASANSTTVLATARFDHFVVDDAAGVQKIFSSRGAGSSSLLVTDLAGGSRTNIGGLAGVTGLARSADGATVFAAASDARQIVAIDATQDPPAVLGRLQLPDGTCPTSVAVAHQTVFFGYTTGNTAGACNADSGDIGSADFSVPTAPTSTLGLRDGVDLPGTVEIAGTGDVLAAGVVSSSAAVGVPDDTS